MAAKERTKENCRCFDAADPRPRGCTPLGIPKRKSEDSAAKRTQYYCPFLTPPNLPPPLSRVLRGCERGATVERSETGVVSNACPCGASNRTSGPALLAGGARCAPPSAPNPRYRKQQSVGAGHARPATFTAISLSRSIRRGGIHPSRALSAAASGHGGQRAGRPTHDPGRTADLRGVEDAAPYNRCANSPAICSGRACPARNFAISTRLSLQTGISLT